jgi:hypothetical protein
MKDAQFFVIQPEAVPDVFRGRRCKVCVHSPA